MNSLDVLWNHLVEVKNQEFLKNKNFKSLYYSPITGFSTESRLKDIFCLSFIPTGHFQNRLDLHREMLFLEYHDLQEEIITYARLYFPLLMAAHLQISRPFIMSHFAQTLDGKICTNSGKSKWISNEENLIHCHRLRAIVDGVLVGGGTIKADNPQLTVRRVEGENPKRIFWCSSIEDFTPYQVNDTYTLLVAHKEKIKNRPDGIDQLISYSNQDNPIPEVLEKLKASGIHSVFIEGGNQTLSNFFEAQMIDIMQIHIAPIIFGSGKSAFDTKPIDEVSESLRLEGFFSNLGGHILYHGRPMYKK
jgi:diaminohydroxyphosphoribosylaminopyrimidine deaminase / 5-amino-6-(5-phosphoribosylamino)uracil reductase